jgi:ABC-type dipeptide/oligopeptide/nickel transport system permease component
VALSGTTSSGFLGRKLRELVVAMWFASLAMFVFSYILPGDPIRALFGVGPAPPEEMAALRAHYGLDDPLYVQYLKFVWNLLHGDFGLSVRGGSVNDIIGSALPISFRLLLVAIAGQIVFGIAAGVLATLRKSAFLRHLVNLSTVVVLAIPVYILARIAQAVVIQGVDYLPVVGVNHGWRSYVAPGIVLAAVTTAYVARIALVVMGDTIREPYIKTARGNGIPRRRIVSSHALRPALATLVTLIAANTAQFLTALIFVEGVFEMPGLGGQVFSAIRARDHAVITGILTVVVFAVIAMNMLVDLLHAGIDPRIKRR